MLLQYVVSNFKSIGRPVEFSMFPIKESTDERFLKTIHTKYNGDWKVLRRGGFFGPNAAGKSSFIESVAFARAFVVNGQGSGKRIRIDQFRGDMEELDGISTFQFVFYLDEEIYEYGFSVDTLQVHEEWLMLLTKEGFAPLFTRVTDNRGKTEIDIEDNLASKDTQERNVAEVLKATIREEQKNQLFLYKLYDNGSPLAQNIVNWFKRLQVIFPYSTIRDLPLLMNDYAELRTYIKEMLRKMDTGVEDIITEREEIDLHDFAEKVQLPREILEELEEISNGSAQINGKYFSIEENERKRTVLLQQSFLHRLNGMTVPLDLDSESDGTKRLLDLLPILFSLRIGSPAIYFVDEIDRSLHTKLSRYFLTQFADECENGFSQIIFTAHDVNLISMDNFRQEEIWFVEKNQKGESRLRPLSDFDLKKGQDVLKGYLNGRFGAIPVIRGSL